LDRRRHFLAGATAGLPQKILAQGADWRFLNELRKELKG
jgi:hypothetical protein